jgi:hypothetical protein
LAKNWSIDIAHELEDYLTDLENIKITLDGGKTTVNFAEAALIIQGSACIYSKKVEYLYTLVFDILNHIIEKKFFSFFLNKLEEAKKIKMKKIKKIRKKNQTMIG